MLSSQGSPPILEKSFRISCNNSISRTSSRGEVETDPELPLVGVDTDTTTFTKDDDAATATKRPIVLNFAMLGCETKEPYGPLTHTAQLLIDMLGMAAIQANTGTTTTSTSKSRNDTNTSNIDIIVIRMHIYNVQAMEYPQSSSSTNNNNNNNNNTNQWDIYDGIIIPGSLSAAYDTDPWIEQLKHMIQTEIVPRRRKTLGICFGHQVMAHSFRRVATTTIPTTMEAMNDMTDRNDCGRAVPTPTGPRAGRFRMPLTSAGQQLLQLEPIQSTITTTNNKDDTVGMDKNDAVVTDVDVDQPAMVQMYYTHGDMVERIPTVAVTLGGDTTVPIQSVAYFATKQDADLYNTTTDSELHTTPATNSVNTPATNRSNSDTDHWTKHRPPVLPYAITVQAHPEYSTTSMEMGIHRTLFQCMTAMEQKRKRRPSDGTNDSPSREDAIRTYDTVRQDSIALMARIGQLLGWF